MDNILLFIILTAALSALQVWDVYRIYFAGENSVSIDWAFTLIEFIWVFFCIVVIFIGDLERYEMMVPVSFLLYNIYGWIVGYWYIKETDILETKIYYIPNAYLLFSLIYSGCITVLSLFIFSNSYIYRNEQSILAFFYSNRMALFWLVMIFTVIYFVLLRIRNYLTHTIDTQVKAAIQSNKQCSDYFGKIISVCENMDITVKLEIDTYGYLVRGTKSNGFLVAKIITVSADEEFICYGYICTKEGEIIKLEDQALEA